MSPNALLADAEELVIAWLVAASTVTAIVADRVSTRIPPDPVWPLLTARRVSGTLTQSWEDSPVVQVDCWGAITDDDTGETTAALLARTIVAALPTLLGAWVLSDGTYHVTGVDMSSGPTSLTDPDTGRSRYTLDLLLTTSP